MNDTVPDQDQMLAPATPEERERFRFLQERFAQSYTEIFDDAKLPRSVLIVPSLSLDQQVMAKISGVHHYEERLLCLLLLLRMPRTRVIYVTSTPIHESIIDYYLHLLPGVPGQHARGRLILLSCDDASPIALTSKILSRPRLIERIKQAIPDTGSAHMTCFTVSELERRLALRLDLPIYGCDPSLAYWGTKSGSRKVFREAGIDHPAGFEDLADPVNVADALVELKAKKPRLRKAVVKLNEGFSGEGNALLDLEGAPERGSLMPWLRARLPHLAFEAKGMTWETFQEKLGSMGGIVEEFVPGQVKESPSAQLRVDPNGRVEVISTHDQVLGGRSGQIFWAAGFRRRSPIGSIFRKRVYKQHSCWLARGLLAVSASTSSQSKKAIAGAIWQSRSICARAAPPIPSRCCSF